MLGKIFVMVLNNIVAFESVGTFLHLDWVILGDIPFYYVSGCYNGSNRQ